MKKQDGITLIALIVTIIVLLILAAVSITAITDENKGVVSKAQEAAQKAKDERENEEGVLGEINTEIDAELNGGTTEEPELLAGLISSTNYGDKTNYSINGIDDWRIFYENEDGRIFLIADYLPVEKVEENMEMETAGTYQYFWTETPDFVTPTQSELFMATGYTLNSTYRNSKCAAVLLNVSKWTSFVDTTLADYAIGSPTLEMWIASWNEKYDDDFSLSTGTRGAVLSGGDLSSGYAEAEENCESTGYGTVYFPHTHASSILSGEEMNYEGCCGYWLATPMDGTPAEISSICYLYAAWGSGLIDGFDPQTGDPDSDEEQQMTATDASLNTIRPVVCLKEGVKAVKSADGTWNLSM